MKKRSSLTAEIRVNARAIREVCDCGHELRIIAVSVAIDAIDATGVAGTKVVDAIRPAHRVILVLGTLASNVATRV